MHLLNEFNQMFSPFANEVWGKVISSQVCVIPSIHKGVGESASRRVWGLHPWGVCLQGGVCIRGALHPGGGGLHPGRLDRPPLRALQDTVNKRAVCILLECILVFWYLTGFSYSYFQTSWNIEAFSLCMFLTSTKLSEWSPMERRAPAQSSSRDQCI